MSRPDAITASPVPACQAKSRAESSGICLLPSSGHLPPGESIDPPRLEQGDPAMRERIRQALVADKTLSLYAHNIEILVGQGGVTLNGPVKSQAEKKRIESDVAAVVNVGKVFSKLVVRPSQNITQTNSLRQQEPDDDESRAEEECCRIQRLWGIREKSRARTCAPPQQPLQPPSQEATRAPSLSRAKSTGKVHSLFRAAGLRRD